MKKYNISKEESALFREAMRDVGIKAETVPCVKGEDDTLVSEPIFLSDYYSEIFNPEDKVDYFAAGSSLEPKVLKQIQCGKYPIDQKVDLHGDTIDSAREALIKVMQKAQKNQWRCLLIIHGKGHQATLKNHVIHWLKQIACVLYFCTAEKKDGGTGALYVFLKREKKDSNTENLKNIRNHIDSIDDKITKLLCQRLEYAKKAAMLKETARIDIIREQNILKDVTNQAEILGYSGHYIQKIFEEILEQMRAYQKMHLKL